MSWVGVSPRITRSWSPQSLTALSMWTLTWRSSTSSPSMTRSSPSPWACTLVSNGRRAGDTGPSQQMSHFHFSLRIWTNNTVEPEFWYPVSLEFLNDLWIPNVFIYNLKSFQNIAVLKRLAGQDKKRIKGIWGCIVVQSSGLTAISIFHFLPQSAIWSLTSASANLLERSLSTVTRTWWMVQSRLSGVHSWRGECNNSRTFQNKTKLSNWTLMVFLKCKRLKL